MRGGGFSRVDSSASYLGMVLVHTTWFLAIAVERGFRGWQPPDLLLLFSVLIFCLAQALRLWAITSLGRQWNVQVMAPAHSSSDPGIVTTGPYRYIRHPNYLAVILEFFSLPLLSGAPVTAVVWSMLNGVVLRYRIRAEEEHLVQRPGYLEVFGNTPRLLPFRPLKELGQRRVLR
jgi:methyltransferase